MSAKELTVVAGWDKPPYVITETLSGFELDLVNTILTRLGHTMTPVFVPFGRSARQLENGVADIVLTLSADHLVPNALLSDVYVAYQNSAISLASRDLTIEQPDDLFPYTVLAFQTAQDVLGPAYQQAVAGHKGYIEIAAQQRQVKMLLLGSVDVAVMDRNIFNWLRSQLPPRFQKEVIMHDLFERNEYRAAILNTELRQQFNTQLQRMKQDGSYDKLIKKYRLSYSNPPTGES
ncbi:substrate-binding periplasmic protein [Salinimonas marina]|uniref:substrate-binding periplasmic protein n=1 Tax=Salinimonas marina TaxID=2785918 RepID=UPI001E4EC6E6|nr:transporter substrate-binding domain-containing protein [Salinimonas marina]